MYTIFHPEQDALVRDQLVMHEDFERGEWGAERLAAHQRTELRKTLRYVTANSPFYRKRLSRLTTADVDGFELSHLTGLPFTTKEDLRTNPMDMLSRPVADGWVFYETTGTTGQATPCPRDNTDSAVNNMALTINYRNVLRAHPARHLIAIMGPTELHSTGDTFGDVFRNLGHAVAKMWPHSPVVGFRRALELLRELQITGVVCTPGMAMSMAKEACALGMDTRRDFSLQFIMVVGELVTPALLDNIGSIWSAKVYNCMYASQEASIMAAVRADGMLRTIPLNNAYEVVEPETGDPVAPAPDGVRMGELVVTHLYRGCKPLIRYRTGDIVRLHPAKGTDDYPAPVLQPMGRARDAVRLNDTATYAYDLEQTVLTHVSTSLAYQIVIDNDGRDRLTVRVECPNPTDVDVPELRAAVRHRYGIDPTVEMEDIGAIAGTGAMVSWKASRVHDRRVATDRERDAALAIAARREAR